MAKSKKIRRWSDSDSEAPPVSTDLPLQLTFRHMPGSPAVAARLEAEVRKLTRYFDRIRRCHVVVIAPHRHRRHGRHYSVHVELEVPGQRLAVTHEPVVHAHAGRATSVQQGESRASHQDIYVVIRRVFDVARRRLEEYVRQTRGDVNQHWVAASAEG